MYIYIHIYIFIHIYKYKILLPLMGVVLKISMNSEEEINLPDDI